MKDSISARKKGRQVVLKKLLKRQSEEAKDRPYHYTLTSISKSIPYDQVYGRISPHEVNFLLKQDIQEGVVSEVIFMSIDRGICGTGVRINDTAIGYARREINRLEGLVSQNEFQ